MVNDHLGRIFESVKTKKAMGEDVIELNVGEPEIDPPRQVLDGLLNSIKNKRFKYGQAAGEDSLREKLALENKVSRENIVIGPGSKFLIYSFLKTVLNNPIDEVIIPTPYWNTFSFMLQDLGINKIHYLHTLLEDKWQFRVEELSKLINKNTKCIILTNPNNPTSTVIDRKTLDFAIDIAGKHNIFCLVDGAYKDLIFKEGDNWNPDFNNHKNLAYSFTFSKRFSMTGFRLGYLLAEEQIVEKIKDYNRITITNVPLFVQDSGLAALNQKDNYTRKMREVYSSRADMACEFLEKNKLKFVKPQAGFYVFVYIKQDSEKFAYKLLEKGVAVVPGTSFGPYKGFIRISLTEAEDRIQKGLQTLKNTL